MSEQFNGKRLLEAIIMTEERVGALYKMLAQEADSETIKELFENLAKDEDRHKKIYSALLKRLPLENEVVISEQEIEFNQTLIDTNVVTNQNMKKRYSDYDNLLLAEKIERDGIMFIHQLRSLYPSFAKEEIEIILSEEKKHLQAVLDRNLNKKFPGLHL